MIKIFKSFFAVILLALILFTNMSACSSQNTELDKKLTESLCSSSWTSGFVRWSDDNDSGKVEWLYTFNEDGTGTRLDYYSFDGDVSQNNHGPWDIKYKFIHKNGKVYLRINTTASQVDYLLDCAPESGSITNFKGLVQFRDDYTATYNRILMFKF